MRWESCIIGNVYNNPGCDTASIYYEFPTFCELFDVNIQKIDSSGACCTYKIDLTIDYELGNLLDCSANLNIRKLLDSLYFKSSLEHEPFRIQETDSLAFDTLNGLISFQYTPCPDSIPTNTSFKFYVSNNGVMCEIDSIDFPSCACACPDNVNDWVDIKATKSIAPCGEDECRVDINIEIPSLEGKCYEFYKIDNNPTLQPLPPNGIISYTLPCIFKGESKEIKIKLYETPIDTTACIINKVVFCPYIDTNDLCEDSCVVEWDFWYGLEMNLPGCDPDCKLKIDYASRRQYCTDIANETYDIQILKMESFSINPNNTNACAFCNYADEQLYKLAVMNIIYKNKMGYPPFRAGFASCRDYWRIFNKSCWVRLPLPQYGTVENPTPNFALVPCEDVSCCKAGLRVCYDVQNNLSITVSQPWADIDSCSDNQYYRYNYRSLVQDSILSVVYDSAHCYQTCEDWLNNLDTIGYHGKLAFSGNEIIESEGITFEMITQENQIELNLFSNSEFNNSKISMFDMQGRLVLVEPVNIMEGINKKVINTSFLHTGLYLIQLNLNYKKLINHKFIIVR